MSSKLSAKRENLVQFLEAIQKVNDTFIFDLTESGKASVVVATSDETCYFYGETEFTVSPSVSLNIPDVRKLVRAIKFIPGDEVPMTLTTNAIKYASSSLKFTYHLYDESFLKRPKFTVERFKAFTWDVSIPLKKLQIQQIIKNSSFVGDASKMYLYVEDDCLKGEITDKARANTDSFGMTIAENIGVDFSPIIIKLDNIQLLNMVTEDITLKINTEKGVLVFEIAEDTNKFWYILTSLRE